MKERDWVKLWLKERDEVMKTYDVEKFKEFYLKWKNRGFYLLGLPSDSVIERSMRKGVYHMESATEEEKAEAKEWLESHGYTTEIG